MDDNTNRVRTRDIDWKQMVLQRWGKDWAKPDPAYEFTGKTFEEPKNGGPYQR